MRNRIAEAESRASSAGSDADAQTYRAELDRLKKENEDCQAAKVAIKVGLMSESPI